MDNLQFPSVILKPVVKIIKDDPSLKASFSKELKLDFDEFASRQMLPSLLIFHVLQFMSRKDYQIAGLLVGVETPIGFNGEIDYFLSSCNTLGQAIVALVKYYPVFGFLVKAPSLKRLKTGEVELTFVDNKAQNDEFFIVKEAFVSVFMGKISHLTQGETWPSCFFFPRGAMSSEKAAFLEKHCGCEVREGDHYGLIYDSTAFNYSLPFANPRLASVLKTDLDERLRRSQMTGSNVEKVINIIRDATDFNEISQAKVAEALFTSESSLKRALASEGTSFSNIIASYKKELSMRLVLADEHKIETIAHLLGYSDRASFERAFKNWFQFTPMQLKKMTRLLGINAQKIGESDVFALPASSQICQQILQMIEKDDYDVSHLAELVDQDPVLTAKLLGVANSAFYGGQNVDNVEDAIVKVLGIEVVQSLAVSLMACRELKIDECPSFDITTYWLLALASAEAARAFSGSEKLSNDQDSRFLVLAALLHNIGAYAMAHLRPRESEEFINTISGSKADTDLAQQLKLQNKVFSISTCRVGYLLLSHWGLPAQICNMINQLESAYLGDSKSKVSVKLLAQLTEYMRLLIRFSDGSEYDQSWVDSLSDLLDLEPSEVKLKLVKIANQIDDLKQVATQLSPERRA